MKAVEERDLSKLLKLYDNKGLFSIAALHIRSTTADNFKNWIIRMLNSGKLPMVTDALKEILPVVTPR